MTDNHDINLLPIGTELQGRYRVQQHLARGGFGNTYLVDNTRFNELWVMKEFFMRGICERDQTTTTITVSGASRPQFESQREKFNNEAKRLRRLHHQGIVHVEDLFDENGTSYYVMDYIPGGSLAEAINMHGPLSEGRIRQLLPPLLDALAYVHSQHIWHLDLKPSNIMLRADGTPVIIDFGASKQMDLSGPHSTSIAMAYTQGYAPTEQVEQNLNLIGPWIDLYALGATLYRLLTGTTPPLTSEIQESGAAAFTFPAGISQQMQQLIQWMMKPSRRERPQSVGEVQQFLGQTEVTGTVVGAEADATQVAESTVSTTNVASPVLSTPSSTPTPHPTPVKEKTDRKGLYRTIIACAAVALVAALAVWIWNTLSSKDINEPDPDSIVGAITTDTSAPSIETITVNGVSFNMVKVEGGTFIMGATSEQGYDAYDNEKPAHRVTLSTYYIGETEVTQALWTAVMGSNPSLCKGDALPVERVSWDDCQAFINKLNSLTGRNFRLPTEAEWEYAARGGNKSRGYKYSGSNDLGSVAWYEDNSGRKTHAVKTKLPNELGLFDMSGNVWEWCQDYYMGSYSSSAQTNPSGPSSGSFRVYRGGSWYFNATRCRVAYRDCYTPTNAGSYNNLGFRLAL